MSTRHLEGALQDFIEAAEKLDEAQRRRGGKEDPCEVEVLIADRHEAAKDRAKELIELILDEI